MTERNRLKRLARECFRRHPELPPRDYLVYFFPEALAAERRELRLALEAAFARCASVPGR